MNTVESVAYSTIRALTEVKVSMNFIVHVYRNTNLNQTLTILFILHYLYDIYIS